MFDLQDILLNIYESHSIGKITDNECDSLVESANEKYVNQFIVDFEAYYIEGFVDKLKDKFSKKKPSDKEVEDTIQKIKDKDGNLTKKDKTTVAMLILSGAIGLAYGLAIVGYNNRDAIIAEIDNHRARSTKHGFADQLIEYVSDCIDDGEFIDAKLALYESELYDTISESAFDFIYSLITEAEEDHTGHMAKKAAAAKNLDKDLDKLPNKKFKTKKDGSYVDPEKTKKEELKYKYRGKMHKREDSEGRQIKNMENSQYGSDFSQKPASESDLKMLKYMKAQAEKGDPEALKKYKQVFKMFCVKHGVKEDSSLYVQYSPLTVELKLTEWKSGKKVDSKKTQNKENIHAIPKGYMLIHKTKVDKLKELKPSIQSSRYMDAGSEGVQGQYHDSGRVYFVLQKEASFKQKVFGGAKDNLDTNGFGTGDHIYKLISPISGFYVDGESGRTNSLDRSTNIEKFVGKGVFVKTDKPLKVRQLK